MTPHERPFRFGVQAARADDGEGWARLARKAESLGYSILSLPDHFGGQFAPMPALAAAAAATTKLRVGSLVFDNDFRHPVVLAKEVSTLDVLSAGRVELGLGAGWLATDYERSGIPYDSPGVRISRMEEGLAVLRGLMAEGRFTFHGSHYSVSGMDGYPKPVQRPHPPILIGGGGRRILSIAAREADVVGVNANARAGRFGIEMAADATPAATELKVAWIREAAGVRFDQLELSVNIFLLMITDHRQSAAAAAAAQFGLSVEDVLGVPYALFGTIQQICDELLRRRELYGFSYVNVQAEQMEAFAPVVDRLGGR